MARLRTEIREPFPAWVTIGRDDAREWWRDHPQASFSEFAEWVSDHYEPHIFRSGFGWTPGRRLTALEKDILDDIHTGIAEAWQGEITRRRRSRAA